MSKRQRRPNGAGSVYQRKDGRWVCAFPGLTPIYFAGAGAEQKAHAKLAELQAKAERGDQISAGRGPTVRDHVEDDWSPALERMPAKGRGRKPLAPRSVKLYRQHVEHHLLPRIGDMRIRKVGAARLEAILTEIANTPVPVGPRKEGQVKYPSDSTMMNIAAVFRHLFSHAHRKGVIDTNPMRDVEVPIGDPERREPPVPTPAQYLEMLQVDDPLAVTFVQVLIGLGGRIEERLRLRWSDINWDTGEVFSVGKGDKEHAVVADASLLSALRRWRMLQYPTTDDDGLVFPSPVRRGSPLTYQSMLMRMKKAFDPILPGVRPHSFRKARATWAEQAGVPLTVLQKDLNHSDARTTQVYLKTDRAAASDTVSRAVEQVLARARADSGSDSNADSSSHVS